MHLDTTSLTLYGQYETADVNEVGPVPCLGHSKAHRPDLKQVVLSMVQMGSAHIPVWMEALNGNSSDKRSFHETVKKIESFYKDIKGAPENLCFVLDGAFYNIEKLNGLTSVNWITRVPGTLKAAQEHYCQPEHIFDWHSVESDKRYKIAICAPTSEASNQRWIMVHSEPAYHREYKTFCKKMHKACEELEKKIWHLGNQHFNCKNDAEQAMKPLLKKLKYFQLSYEVVSEPFYNKKGRPDKNKEPDGFLYRIEANIASDLAKVQQLKNGLGRFILATNVLDLTELSNAEILKQYKGLSHVETGFKFIKNDAFELDNVFLKSQSRIGALMMVMTLCLLVYNFAQYELRMLLKAENDVLPNQVGKPILNPTAQWIFTLMASIAVVEIYDDGKLKSIITNVQPLHEKIIAYFGVNAKHIYGVPIDLVPSQVKLNQKIWLEWCGL